MLKIDDLANEIYVAVVNPDLTWWDDLTPDMQEAWRKGARKSYKYIIDYIIAKWPPGERRFLSELLLDFDEDSYKLANIQCPFKVFHGAGHQSRTMCQVKGPHTTHVVSNLGWNNDYVEWAGNRDLFYDNV